MCAHHCLVLQAWCRGTSSGSRALCRPAQGCRATTREPQEDRCGAQFSQMFRVRLLFFSWQKQHVTRNASVFHRRLFLLLQEVLLHHIPISLFVTISEGVYRAEAPLLLLCYRSSLSPCPLSIVISRQTTATGTMIPETLRNVQLLGEYLNIKQQQALVRSTCSSQGWIYEQNCRQSLGQEL